VVTLVNLGGQRLGLSEATEDVRDLEQSRLAIDSVRALLPLLESDEQEAAQLRPVRDALAQLQLAYAQQVQSGEGAKAGDVQESADQQEQAPPRPKQSGRLWVPPGSGT
jgi:hypothetical protein